MRHTKLILILAIFLLTIVLATISADENRISTEGLIAHYEFNEGTGEILHDRSGNTRNGIISEAIWAEGISGNALEFNGRTTSVNLPASTLGNWNALTYAFWMKAPQYSGSGWPAFFGSYTTSYTYNTCICISQNTETIHLEIDTDTGNYETNGEIQIPWDNWVHVALVYDGSSLTEYINGVQGKSIPATGYLKNVTELHIGQLGNNRYFFTGVIDEAYIYSRALSSAEIKQLYDYGASLSYSSIMKENNAIENSPLNTILSKEAIPLAATLITIVTIGLWNLFGSVIIDFLSDYSSEKIIDFKEYKKKKSKKSDTFTIPYIQLTKTEIFNIIIAVIVFSIALSWTWGTSIHEILTLFLINIIIIGVLFIFRELLRVHYSTRLHLQTNHILWPFGAILTLASTFLGNTFSLASYTTAENEEDGRYAQMLFNSNIIFYSIALVTFIIHLLMPFVVFQMIFIFLIMTLTIEMTPIKPMDGAIIRTWNIKKWISFYIIIVASYVLMLFIL